MIEDGSPPLIEIEGFAGDAQPDGVIVAADDAPAGDAEPLVVVRAEVAESPTAAPRVREIRIAGSVAPRAPRTWFVALPEPAARPPAMTLIAYPTKHQRAGAVIDQETFTGLPVRSSEQVAAFRWWTSTGQAHEIYVNPSWRRRHLAIVMMMAAEGYRATQGWAPIWMGGERTDLGEVAVRGAPAYGRARITRRTKVLPPMTPPGR
jgi:hypothetical protein